MTPKAGITPETNEVQGTTAPPSTSLGGGALLAKTVAKGVEELPELPGRPYILGSPENGDAPIMGLGRVHMIGGASGAGKTTLLFQLIGAILNGDDFLDYPTQYHPFVYCAFDRDEEETGDTLRRIGLNPDDVPSMTLKMEEAPPISQRDMRWLKTLEAIRAAHPLAKVIFIDGFYILVSHGNINNFLSVACFLAKVREYCQEKGVTIVGVAHTSKQKQNDKIVDPRQRLLGSVAGAGFTSCGILVERNKPENDDGRRSIWVLPRNSEDAKYEMRVDYKGRFVPDRETEADRLLALESFIENRAVGEEIPVADILKHMSNFKASRTTVYRYLARFVLEQKVVKLKHGAYVRPGLAKGIHVV